MAFIEWSREYSVGINEIDEQHQKLVSLANELYSAIASGRGDEGLNRTFQGLVDYARTHFSYEEKMLAEAGYPNLPAHQAEHRQLIQRIIDYFGEYRAKLNERTGAKQLPKEVLNFLRDWLFNHIRSSDMEYSRYIHSR